MRKLISHCLAATVLSAVAVVPLAGVAEAAPKAPASASDHRDMKGHERGHSKWGKERDRDHRCTCKHKDNRHHRNDGYGFGRGGLLGLGLLGIL
ncbi:hypothetical protein QOM21_00645 [Streptomyces sp. Pv4-95]|uniref:hypothetical protein n=1 Tax=Streptomyces sp. Pv4-95 TaxID=3049543 RepID=UPI00389271FF